MFLYVYVCTCICKHEDGRDRNSIFIRDLGFSRKKVFGYTGEDVHSLVPGYQDA